MRPKSRPSATSLMVKSNSLRATKSMALDAFSVASGSTATLAPIMPIFKPGLSALSASAVLTSEEKEGVDVCSTTRSCFPASGAMSWNFSRWGGASMSFEPSTSAAGCASHVGYQNDWISRRA